MIIMPHIDGCTIVTESGFCSVMGHPYDIIEGLFIKRTKIDDITTVIAPSVKEVSVLEGNIHAGYYIDLLKQIGVKVNIIPQKYPAKVFKVGNFTPYTSSLFIMCDFRLSDTKSRTFLSILSSSCCVLC